MMKSKLPKNEPLRLLYIEKERSYLKQKCRKSGWLSIVFLISSIFVSTTNAFLYLTHEDASDDQYAVIMPGDATTAPQPDQEPINIYIILYDLLPVITLFISPFLVIAFFVQMAVWTKYKRQIRELLQFMDKYNRVQKS